MAKIKASGKIDGEPVTVECIKRDGHIMVYKNGKENVPLDVRIAVLIAEKNEGLKSLIPDGEISPIAIESYLLILREDIFDEPPEIETEGINVRALSFFTAEHDKNIIF